MHPSSGNNASSGQNFCIFVALDLEDRFGIRSFAAPGPITIELEVDPLSLDRLTAACCVAPAGGLSGMKVTNLGIFLWKHMDNEAIRKAVTSPNP